MTTSPWRVAIGAGLLAAGVMIGGAPIVQADSDSGASDGSSAHTTENHRTLHNVSAKLGIGQRKSTESRTSPTDSIRSAGAALTRTIVGAARLDRSATLPTSRRQQQAAAGAPPSSVVRRVTEPSTNAGPSTGGQVVPASIAAVTSTVTNVQNLATDAVVTAIPELAGPIAAAEPILQLPVRIASQLSATPSHSRSMRGLASPPPQGPPGTSPPGASPPGTRQLHGCCRSSRPHPARRVRQRRSPWARRRHHPSRRPDRSDGSTGSPALDAHGRSGRARQRRAG